MGSYQSRESTGTTPSRRDFLKMGTAALGSATLAVALDACGTRPTVIPSALPASGETPAATVTHAATATLAPTATATEKPGIPDVAVARGGAPEDMVNALRNLSRAKDNLREGGAIDGFHVEGPHIASEDGPRGAHPKRWVRPPDFEEFKRLQEAARGGIRLVTLSPEWPEVQQAAAQLHATIAEHAGRAA